MQPQLFRCMAAACALLRLCYHPGPQPGPQPNHHSWQQALLQALQEALQEAHQQGRAHQHQRQRQHQRQQLTASTCLRGRQGPGGGSSTYREHRARGSVLHCDGWLALFYHWMYQDRHGQVLACQTGAIWVAVQSARLASLQQQGEVPSRSTPSQQGAMQVLAGRE